MKDILITGVYLSILAILLGRVDLTGNPDPYVLAGKVIGGVLGMIISIPLFNAYLTKKYLDFPFSKKHPLVTMFTVGTVSLIINDVIVFLVIVGAIGLNKITSKKIKK